MVELARAAVLADGADRALVKPLRPLRLDLHCHLDLAVNLAGEWPHGARRRSDQR